MKIAMWSGPRNLSTAMMYAFGNRSDFAVSDEPFYCAYLHATGIEHPMMDAFMHTQPIDPVEVAQACVGPNPDGKSHWYQKQLTHQMAEGFPMDWMGGVTNVFLIRHPARVVTSYLQKRATITEEDIGVRRQHKIFEHCCAMGQNPVVIDSDDILRDPEHHLRKLCDALGLPFDLAMLSWPSGPKPFDGAWAPHWYDSVHRSTGLEISNRPMPAIPKAGQFVLESALPIYEAMALHKLS